MQRRSIHSHHDGPLPESSFEASSSSSAADSDNEETFGEYNSSECSFINEMIERLMRAPLTFSNVKRGNRESKAAKYRPIAPEVNVKITQKEIIKLCYLASESFLKQKSLVEISKDVLPVCVVGDIHGQFRDLRMMLYATGEPTEYGYVFLGDYVDRGPQGIEVLCLLLSLKIKYPHKIFMLRGNHEDLNTTMVYGFYDECGDKYSDDSNHVIFHNIVHVFNCMPFAALIAGKILCMHGGISPDLIKLSDINSITRPTLVPMYGLATDLVWSDPGGKRPGWTQSNRGISFTYDDNTISNFCKTNKIDLIVRGHQINQEMRRTGYVFTSNNQMLTIFSAFNYLNTNNTGATLQILPGMKCRFRLFRPFHPKKNQQRARSPPIIAPVTEPFSDN